MLSHSVNFGYGTRSTLKCLQPIMAVYLIAVNVQTTLLLPKEPPKIPEFGITQLSASERFLIGIILFVH